MTTRILILFCLVLFNTTTAFAGIDFGTVKAVPVSVISISPKNSADVPVMFGGSVQLEAETYPEGMNVTWSVIPEAPKDGEQADATIDSSGLLKAVANSGSGWVKVTAAIDGGAKKEARVFIGCSTCQAGSGSCDSYAGTGFVELGSINFRISLGTAKEGLPAGDIYVYAKEPSHDLATPKALQISTLSKDIETLYIDEKLRQVITPQAIVSILQLTHNYYEIFFYEKDAAGEFAEGVFIPAPTTVPETLWQIEGSTLEKEFTNLSITEIRQGTETTHLYSYNKDENEWSLSSGNGSKFESSKEYTDKDGDRVVRSTISGNDGDVISITETTYHEYEWGEKPVKHVVDPDGLNLETITTYYEHKGNGYGKIKSRIQLDGSWEKFVYDQTGRIITTIRPWLDSQINEPETNHQVIEQSYTPLQGDTNLNRDAHKARVITKRVKGIVTSKAFNLFTTDKTGGRVEISEQCLSQNCTYGDKSNLRTVSTYYPEEKDVYYSGKLKSVLQPDGNLTSYQYETGVFTPSQNPEKARFSPGEGKAIRKTVVHGTAKHPEGIPYKTTQETSIIDWFGNTVMAETYVVTDTDEKEERLNWTYNSYSAMGRLIETLYSNQTRVENSWNCCGKASTTDINGITTSYNYDDLKRITQQVNESTGVVTEYTYDAMGRRLSSSTKNRDLMAKSTSQYDMAGRISETADQGGLITSYFYDKTTSSIIRPGDKEETTKRYLDGKIKSITGSGVVDRYYNYGINEDGSQWTKITIAKVDSPRYEKTTTDLLGRVIEVEKPGFTSSEIAKTFYNERGQVIKTTSPGLVDTLYVYDELGNQLYSGLDVDDNGKLILASNDRILGQTISFVKENDAWWKTQTKATFAHKNSDIATPLSTSKTRLSGWKDFIISENIQIDTGGNKTTSFEKLDRYNQERTRVTNYPDSTINAVQRYKNNQLVSTQSKTGIIQTYSYDLLGRRISVTDQRTGTSTTKYNKRHQIESVTDSINNTTKFIYDEITGQKIAQINPAGKITRFNYNSHDQIIATWGDVPYPVSYEFNEYDELVSMNTYRTGSNWSDESWPENQQGDKTSWIYDEATGLLKEKKDAQGHSIQYSYTSGGKLSKRTWARGVSTKYGYLDTGELINVDYSDTTPDIFFTYDRLGRKESVTDALGERTFRYDDNLKLLSETLSDNTVIEKSYDELGRNNGFALNDFYRMKYDFDNLGRFSTVDYKVDGTADIANYSYLEGYDLISGVALLSGSNSTYAYDPHRNLKTDIQNKINSTLISRYEYQYDSLGRRTNVKNSGSAYNQTAFTLFNYNDRNELQNSSRFIGEKLNNPTNQVKAEYRLYNYDPIGNRLLSQEGKTQSDYVTNNVNQYQSITGQEHQALDYDVDGNLTSIEQNNINTKYVYNAENKLISIEPQKPAEGDTKSLFTYDYMGRRITKQLYLYKTQEWKKTKDISFVYDGWNLIQQKDSLNDKKMNFVWGLDLSQSLQGAGGIGGLLAKVENNRAYTYFYDGNGNVSQMIDEKDFIASYEYDPFGKLTSQNSPTDSNPFRFSTKYFDEEYALYYYGYRFYAPELGRWVNRDPIEEDGGLNLYWFTGNCSVNLVDKDGRDIYDSYFYKWFKVHYPDVANVDANSLRDLGIFAGQFSLSYKDIKSFFDIKSAQAELKLPLTEIPPIGLPGGATVNQSVAGYLKSTCCKKTGGGMGSMLQGGIYYMVSIGYGEIIDLYTKKNIKSNPEIFQSLEQKLLKGSASATVNTNLPDCAEDAKISITMGAKVAGAFVVAAYGLDIPVGNYTLPDTIRWAFSDTDFNFEVGPQGIGGRAEIYGKGDGTVSIMGN